MKNRYLTLVLATGMLVLGLTSRSAHAQFEEFGMPDLGGHADFVQDSNATGHFHHGKMGKMMGKRMAVIRMLNNDECRADLESKMADTDAKALEADVQSLRGLIKQGKETLRPELLAAHKAKDTATVHKLTRDAVALFAEAMPSVDEIKEILQNYKPQVKETITSCKAQNQNHSESGGSVQSPLLTATPLYPNPISVSQNHASQVNFKYTIAKDANVHVELTDIGGNVVSIISDGRQTAGEHTLAVPSSTLKTGAYYIHVIANGESQTLKLAIVD